MSDRQKNTKHEKPGKSFEELAGGLFNRFGGGSDKEKSAFTNILSRMIKPITEKQKAKDSGQAQS